MASIRGRVLRVAVVPVVAAAIGLLAAASPGQAAPKPTLDQVKAQLAALDAQAEVAQEQLNQTQVDLAAAQRDLAGADTRLARSQAQMSAAQRQVGRLASAAYRSGGVDQSVQLLLADNPTRFLEQMSVLDSVSRHQADVLRDAAVARQRLGQDQLAVSQQLATLRRLHAQAAADYAKVKRAQAQETALLNSMEAAQRAALAREREQARARAKAAAEAAAATARAQAAAAVKAAARSVPKPAHTPAGSAHKPSTSGTPSRPHGSSGGSPVGSGGGSIGRRVVAYALAQVGDAYVWGATGPNAFDCSGLTMRAYQQVGVSLPHSSAAQFHSGRRIAVGDLQPGDLVFYYSPIHHVGIYIGGGMIVNAENPGVGVTVAPLYSMPYSGAVRPY